MLKSEIQKNKDDYRRFYENRTLDPSWMDNWQLMVEKIHIKKRSFVAKRILNGHHESICDFGCGTAALNVILKEKGYAGRLKGIDIHVSPTLERNSKEYDFDIQEVNFIDYQDCFEAIVFFSSLHFAHVSQLDEIIKNMYSPHDIYIVEPFITYLENMELNEKVLELTVGQCQLHDEKALNATFQKWNYIMRTKHIFPGEIDPMGRIFTFIHYSKDIS